MWCGSTGRSSGGGVVLLLGVGMGSQMLLVVVVVVVLGDCLLLFERDDDAVGAFVRGEAWSSLGFAFSCAFLPLAAAAAGFRVFETPFVVLLAALFV